MFHSDYILLCDFIYNYELHHGRPLAKSNVSARGRDKKYSLMNMRNNADIRYTIHMHGKTALPPNNSPHPINTTTEQ